MERFAPCIAGVTLEVPLVVSLRSLGWDFHKQADPPTWAPIWTGAVLTRVFETSTKESL